MAILTTSARLLWLFTDPLPAFISPVESPPCALRPILDRTMANNSSSHSSLNRRQVAQALNIPPEMAARNGIPSRMSSAEVAAIDANPPAWLAQSRANSTGKRPIWVDLRCYLCDFLEVARPKKWWPEFTYVICDFHENSELPDPQAGWRRSEYDGVGSRFRGIVDTQDD